MFTEEVLAELQTLIDELEQRPGHPAGALSQQQGVGLPRRRRLCARSAAIRTPQTADQLVIIGQKLFDRLERLPMPTVAVIHGPVPGRRSGVRPGLPATASPATMPRRGWECRKSNWDCCRPGEARSVCRNWWDWMPRCRCSWRARQISARQAVEIGLIDAVWTAEQFEPGVEQFVADRLEGRPLGRRRRGALGAVCASGRSSNSEITLRAARRRLAIRGRHSPALPAILDAVEQGLRQGRAAGLAREREAFPDLLFSPFCRARLRRFLAPPARPDCQPVGRGPDDRGGPAANRPAVRLARGDGLPPGGSPL